jgi:4-amino-4-deoxy-L-arabinose transferase-like glycosyltransferase
MLTRVRHFLSRKLPFSARLGLLLLVGGLVQAYVALTEAIGRDEGNYLSAAAAIARGQTPMVNFPGRDPGIMYYLAIGVKLFGPNIAVAHIQMVILAVGTALLLALLARRLYPSEGERIALLVAGLFLFVPYDVFFGTTVCLEALATFLVTCAAYLIIRDYSQRKWPHLVGAGVLMALAALTRQSAAIVALPFILYLIWTAPQWRARVRESLTFLLPAIAVGGSYVLYLIERTNLVWVLQELWIPPVAGIKPVPLPARLSLIPYTWMIGAAILLVPIIIGAVVMLERKFRPVIKAVIVGALTLLVGVALLAYPSIASNAVGEFGAIGPNSSLFSGEIELAFILIALWIVSLAVAVKWRSQRFPISLPVVGCLAGWALLFVLSEFYIRDIVVSPYLYDAIAPTIILISAWLVSLFPSDATAGDAQSPTEDPSAQMAPPVAGGRPARERKGAVFLAVLLGTLIVLSSALGTILVLGPTNPINVPAYYGQQVSNFRSYSYADLQAATSWIRSHVPANATIFSVDDLFITDAGLLSTPNLNIASSPYFRYPFPSNQSPYPPDTFGLMPSAQQLVNLWNQTHLTWVVEAYRTQLMMYYQPLIGWYFRTYFHPVQYFGNAAQGSLVTILEAGIIPVIQPVTWIANWTAVPSADTVAYEPSYQTFIAGGAGSGNLWRVYPNDSASVQQLPGVKGIEQIASGDGWIWVETASPGQIGLLPMVGSGFRLFSTGLTEAVNLTVNPTEGTVYVLSPPQDTVAAFDTNGNLSWSQQLNCTPSQVAYIPFNPRLLIACQNDSFATVLNPESGLRIATPELEPGLVDLITESNAVVGLNISGGLSRWDSDSWNLTGQNPSAGAVLPAAGINGGGDIVALTPRGRYYAFAAFDSINLAQVGNFTTPLVPNAIASDQGGFELFEAATKMNKISLFQLPLPTSLVVQTPAIATVQLQGLSIVGYNMSVWPGVYHFWSYASGYISGQQLTAILPAQTSATVSVGLGPNISALGGQQFWFTIEVVVLAILAFIVLVCLVLPAPPMSGSLVGPNPTRAQMPDGEGQASQEPPSQDDPSPPS